jgi:uncharacterized protein (TIGR02453 family)
MPAQAPFSPALFRFLRELARHNEREWFQANKARYDEEVRLPALRFVASFAKPLEGLSRHLIADPRPVGGSLFRIHRDVRFAKDKSPYKTHVGIHFRHAGGSDVHAVGLYLHLEPGQVFAAAGVWHPDRPTLERIRKALVGDPAAWRRAVSGRAFRATWELSGDSLRRVPRGYDPEHPLADHLRRKDFVAHVSFREADACAPSFPARLERAWQGSTPLMRFLARALELPW